MGKKKVVFDINSASVNNTINKFANVIRAEKNTPSSFLHIYADKSVVSKLLNINNQIIYGRRGTGKSHLLLALQERIYEENEKTENKSLPIYIDLRKLLPLITQQDTNKVETAVLIYKQIIDYLINTLLDNLKYIFEINEFDSANYIEKSKRNKLKEILNKLNYEFDGRKFKKLGSIEFSKEEFQKIARSIKLSGKPSILGSGQKQNKDKYNTEYIRYISFSDISNSLQELTNVIGNIKVFCLIDEWSELPLNLQPYISELLKRTFIASNYVLKIGAIPYRAKFREYIDNETKVGLEEGGDIFPINLDNRYVFELDKIKTRNFYNELLYKHLLEINPSLFDDIPEKQQNTFKEKLINHFFANQALSEILVASAGIPRDFIHLFINSYENRTSRNRRIVLKNVRNATSSWYGTDKKEEVEKDRTTKHLFEGIVNEIIIKKRKTHFLMPQTFSENKYIKKLVDLRVLHIRQKGISHKHIPEKMYDVYSIDYGSYTSLDIAKRNLDTDFNQLTQDLKTTENVRDARSLSLEADFFDNFLLEIGEGIKCPHCKKTIDTNHLAYKKQGLCNNCFEKVEK